MLNFSRNQKKFKLTLGFLTNIYEYCITNSKYLII